MARSSFVLVPLMSLLVVMSLSPEALGLPQTTQRRSYAGWKVIRIFTSDSSLDDFLKILLQQEEVSVWGMKRLPKDEIQVDALVGPEFSVDLVITFMSQRATANKESNLIHWHTIIDDVEGAIQRRKSGGRQESSSKLDWTNYHRFETIEDYLINTVAHRRRAATVKIGTSAEGRGIYAVVIGNKSKKVASLISSYVEEGSRGAKAVKEGEEVTTLGPLQGYEGLDDKYGNEIGNVIFMDAGIHSREWITIAFATYMIEQLTAEDKDFLDLATFVIIPLANPDGYEYSHTIDRLWRKNRNPSGTGKDGFPCLGIDLNRNFGRNFGGLGTSEQPCSEIYRGRDAFSEPETRAIRDAFLPLRNHVKFYMGIHSYGELILYPWGDSFDLSPHDALLNQVGKSIGESISRFNSSNYKVGQSSRVYAFAAGASDDYFHEQGVKLSYTIELPGDNTGFLLPAERILPVSIETYCALRCVVYQVAERPLGAKKCWHLCGV